MVFLALPGFLRIFGALCSCLDTLSGDPEHSRGVYVLVLMLFWTGFVCIDGTADSDAIATPATEATTATTTTETTITVTSPLVLPCQRPLFVVRRLTTTTTASRIVHWSRRRCNHQVWMLRRCVHQCLLHKIAIVVNI